jgi:hypothetical protein
MTCLLKRLGNRASERMAKFLAERLPVVAILAVLPWLERSTSEPRSWRFRLLPLRVNESTTRRRNEITEKFF